MGRRRAGPVRIGTRSTWYARLTVPPHQCEKAGKKRLIRSLGTSDHGVALSRYGGVYAALEEELRALLSGEAMRQRVDNWNVPELSTYEAATGALGIKELDLNNSLHQSVYDAIKNNDQLPITWDEGLSLWQQVRNRSRSRPLSEAGIYSATLAVDSFRKYAEPHLVTKVHIREWLAEMERKNAATTVATKFKLIKAVVQVLVNEDRLEQNIWSTVSYTASANLDESRRPFTDDELRIIYRECPKVFTLCMMGMRAGEYASRMPKDLVDGVLVIDDQPEKKWRPKSLSSYRRLPVYKGFQLQEGNSTVGSCITRYGNELRKVITDKQAVVHSARHTFITLSRRAQCDARVTEVLTGHSKNEGSKTHAKYGETPDGVLRREITMVWELLKSIVE